LSRCKAGRNRARLGRISGGALRAASRNHRRLCSGGPGHGPCHRQLAHLPVGAVVETVIRVAFVYVFILALFRVMGKREVSQLTPTELVMLLLIPEIMSQALVREDFSMTNGVTSVTTLV